MSEMTEAEWLRDFVAWHEAGHALAAVLVGRPLDYVSTRPGLQFGGITHYGPSAPLGVDGVTLAPLALQPDLTIRERFERSILVALAGGVAERFVEPFTGSGYVPADDDDDRAAASAAALARLSPRHRELVVAAERRTAPYPTDDEGQARQSSAIFNAPAAVGHHVEWLRGEVEAMVHTHERQLRAIHDALLPLEVMTEQEVLAAIGGTACPCHTWPKESTSKENVMSILTRKPKPDPAAIYVAAVSFSWAGEGGPTGIKRGARLRGDHVIVRATFGDGLFAPDGQSESEMSARWTALSTYAVPSEPVKEAGGAEVMMVCTAALERWLGDSAERADVGDLLPAGHQLVRRFPGNFAPAPTGEPMG
jgi:hypothetical protein